MSPLSHTLLAAGLLSLSAGAMAQPPGPPMGGPGGHGMMHPTNRADLKTQLEQHFDAMDANHDGTVTSEERTAYRTEMRTQMQQRMFDRMDTNHDGSISKDEFMAAPRGGMHPGPDGPMARNHMGMMDGYGKMDRHAMKGQRGMAGMWSGTITKTAFVDRGLAMFDRVDTNHDGKISQAERDAARAKMRDMRGRPQMPPPPPPGQ